MRCKVFKFIFHVQPIVSPIIIVKDLISNYGSTSQAEKRHRQGNYLNTRHRCLLNSHDVYMHNKLRS